MTGGQLNESGGEIGIDDFLDTEPPDTDDLVRNFRAEQAERPHQTRQQSRNKERNRRSRKGIDLEFDPKTATVELVFKGEPVCLSILARLGVFNYQHNFLLDCVGVYQIQVSR
jgi:hypothetical protein